MKTRIVAGFVASLFVLAVSEPATAGPDERGARPKAKPTAAAVQAAPKVTPKKGARKSTTADAGATRPAAVMEAEAAKRPAAKGGAAPKPSRFLASGVPLAEVRDGRLANVGGAKLPCGTKSRWAKVRSKWLALDAWGRPSGTLSIGGSARYDGTGCHRVWFSEGTGNDGLGVFVSAGSGYTPGPSAEWKADDANKKRLERLVAAEERAWVEGKTGATTARRTFFFELPPQETAAEGAPTQRRAAHWAVSGGRLLVVAYVGATGAWKVGHVLPPNGKANAYEPLAVMDMNGDGLPEIVVHEEAGGVFSDRVLSFDAGSMRWETVVVSPGGASR